MVYFMQRLLKQVKNIQIYGVIWRVKLSALYFVTKYTMKMLFLGFYWIENISPSSTFIQ